GVNNSFDTAVTGGLAITHSYNSTTCSTSARATSAACAPTLGTAATVPATRTDSITNNGTIAVTQSVTGASCAPVTMANAKSASDPLLPRNAVTFQQTDKWGTTSAAGFSGTGYATDPIGTSGSGVLGLLQGSFSMGLWFKASDAQGGGLISLSGSLSNGSGAANPAVWLDSSGNVHGAIATTLSKALVATSGTNYADGAWHFVVVTVTTVITATITLYVDGANKSSSGGLSLLTSASGIWHVGWSNFTGLTPPSSAYFHGSLSGAFVNNSTALSSTQISTLNTSASASAYQSTLSGQSGTSSIWMLGDSGFSTVAGTSLPAGNIFDPCSKVNITWTFLSPSATIASQSLSAFADNSARSVAAPGVAGTQTLSIATAAGTTYSTDLAGLHLYVPLTFTYGASGATTWTQTFTWSGASTDVFWA
ncbi:MAG TPA: LamG-like jellyroll fold domain-containing protein, partial [Nocardioides sp.]|nr:LamG-like jellyroll fold domain-containing protein [Nocardioides sp.]